ncbi:N-acetyltransferase [Saccharopolyspora rhizosphaerae]|uniref:N-acetyltransferase n=1 Tax=Saccharopolyspora rhizosphaerae TaxID=2492662 RepID=A0A426JIZ5_9PSEU|nr:GNAT family N-acetyltransferase [Saccharopolyspora rhizosphaerae]RRO13146.1 N-acetyltransferase [Saccharopolyspora rhizosphaerae]
MQEPEEMRTRRLVLRALRRSDVDAFVALSTAAETHPFDPHVRKTPDQALVAFDRFMTSWEPDGIGYWLVRLHGAEGVIGFGGLRPWVEDGEPVLNLAYRFWPQAWGQGYAREMAQAALDWARRHRPDKPVLIVTDEDNGPACGWPRGSGSTATWNGSAVAAPKWSTDYRPRLTLGTESGTEGDHA